MINFQIMKKLLILLFVSTTIYSQDDASSSNLYKLNSQYIEKLQGTWVGTIRENIEIIRMDDFADSEFYKQSDYLILTSDGYDGYYIGPLISRFVLRLGDFTTGKYNDKYDVGLNGGAVFKREVFRPEYVEFTGEIKKMGNASGAYYLVAKAIESEFPNSDFKATVDNDAIYSVIESLREDTYKDIAEIIPYSFMDNNKIKINHRFTGNNEVIFEKVSNDYDYEINWRAYHDDFKSLFKIDKANKEVINQPINPDN